MTVALALLTSVLWGFADFGAGLLTRRIPAARVVLLSQTAAALVLGVVVLCTGALSEASPRLWFAVAAGFVGPMALLCFYEALARGPMGVVSPLATAGVVIPVGIGLAVDGDRPGPMQYAGILIALAGIAMAGGPKLGGGAIQRGTLLLTVVAALGFGTVFALLAEASAGVLSLFLAQFVQRVINVAVGGTVLVVTEGKRARRGTTTGFRERPEGRTTSPVAPLLTPEPGPAAAAEGRDAASPAMPARSPAGRHVTTAACTEAPTVPAPRRPASETAAPAPTAPAPRTAAVPAAKRSVVAMLPALTVVGVTDVAANGTYATAAQHGPVTVAAVLGSLYPVVTALAARAFLHERLQPAQAAGAALALSGTVLLAAG